MTVLAQLLPGLRDLRTPMAVGVVWVCALWVLLRPSGVAEVLSRSSFVTQVQEGASALPEPVRSGLILLGLYLLGVVLRTLGDALLPVLRVAWWSLLGLGAIYALRFWLPPALWEFVVVLVVLGGLPVLWPMPWVLRRAGGQHNGWFDYEGSLELVRNIARWTWWGIEGTFSLPAAQVRYVVDEGLVRLMRTNPEDLRAIVAELEPYHLARAVQKVALTLDDIRAQAPSGWPGLDCTTVVAVLGRLHTDEPFRAPAREALVLKLIQDDRCLVAFGHTCFDSVALRSSIRQVIEEAEVLLHAKEPALFDEYERTKAEGQFRLSLAPPLFALICLAGLAYQDSFPQAWHTPLWPVMSAALTAALLAEAGHARLRRATVRLHRCVVHKVVAPDGLDFTMDRLVRRRGVRWILFRVGTRLPARASGEQSVDLAGIERQVPDRGGSTN